MKKHITLAGVLATVLVTGACSGSGAGSNASGSSTATTTSATSSVATSDPVKWTGAFCGGVGPTVEGLVTLLQKLLAGDAADPAAQKAAFLDYAQSSGKAMSDAAAKLEELGPPTADAKAVHDELVKFISDSGEEATRIAEDLQKLDPNDPEFATKLEQLGGDEADPTKLQANIKKIQDDPVLGEAFKKAPECVQMAERMKALGG